MKSDIEQLFENAGVEYRNIILESDDYARPDYDEIEHSSVYKQYIRQADNLVKKLEDNGLSDVDYTKSINREGGISFYITGLYRHNKFEVRLSDHPITHQTSNISIRFGKDEDVLNVFEQFKKKIDLFFDEKEILKNEAIEFYKELVPENYFEIFKDGFSKEQYYSLAKEKKIKRIQGIYSNEYGVFSFNNKKYQNVDAEEVINEIIQRHNNFGKKINESTRMKKQALFSIPSSVPAKFFKITDNLNDVENWRVKILQNNSSENKRLGSFDSVGYIMVSLADNTIIPIARSDEHHRGYEIMDTIYQDEYNINSSKYYPIFCLGNNYPYNQDEALKMKEALAKLKSYGYDLDKLNVSMYYITKGEDERYVTGNEFLNEIESKEEQRKNIPVTPLGKNLVKALEMFSNAFEYKNVRGELSLTKISNAWRQLYNIGKDIMLNKEDVLISWFDDETVSDLLQKYKDGYITEENLMNLVFGFGGIRQKIHNLLRRYHFSQVLVDELGNVDEVVNMIGAI